MSTIAAVAPAEPIFPAPTARLIATALMAGLAADLTWEVWARLSPRSG